MTEFELSEKLVDLCNQFLREISQIEDDLSEDDLEYLGSFLVGMCDDLPDFE